MRRALHRDDTGASAVEYSLVVVGIAAVLVLALLAIGRVVGGTFGSLDCWTATGCTQSMPATQSPAPVPSTPVAQQVQIPESAYAAAPPVELCNESGNGNGKGKGQGSCGH